MNEAYASMMGWGPRRIVHREIWACPEAETALTGIDTYEHPRRCRQRWNELFPHMPLAVPAKDDPRPRPKLDGDDQSADHDGHTVRWGAGTTATFQHGEAFFRDADEVFAFSPLEHADMTGWRHVVNNYDFSSEEALYRHFRKRYPAEWGDTAPPETTTSAGIYNTMFMWPMLTFGWELFMECCLDPRFDRIMDEFAELSRRAFKAMARLPVNFIRSHDDIVMTRGPVCSREWMNRHIFPRYEEFWGIVKAAGKEVHMVVDGCVDAFVDDIMACGARGIVSEPYTDFKAIARRYPNPYLSGEGDNRVLMRNDPAEIEAMVDSMVETGRMSGGYVMSIGNHIPWNVPPDAIKRYLDLTAKKAWR